MLPSATSHSPTAFRSFRLLCFTADVLTARWTALGWSLQASCMQFHNLGFPLMQTKKKKKIKKKIPKAVVSPGTNQEWPLPASGTQGPLGCFISPQYKRVEGDHRQRPQCVSHLQPSSEAQFLGDSAVALIHTTHSKAV